MSDPALRQTCDCGHDIDTHFERGTCLGVRCDCTKYRKPGERDPGKKVRRPQHAWHCQCLGCKEWRNAPIEQRE